MGFSVIMPRRGFAKITNTTPKSKLKKVVYTTPVLIAFLILSKFLAPKFCPTITEVAIATENPTLYIIP